MRIGMIDIGYRNFAISIEHVPNATIKELAKEYEKLPKKDKIVERRPHSDKIKQLLNNFNNSCENILLELTDLNEGVKGLQNSTRRNLAIYLESIKDLLNQGSYIAVEQQFKTGQAMNFDAVLFGEACYSWLVINLPNVDISYTPSRYKTCLLGCPREVIVTQPNGLRSTRPIEKRDRKKWSIETAKKIFESRGDTKSLDYIKNKKADDVCDCILMTIAFVLKTFVM